MQYEKEAIYLKNHCKQITVIMKKLLIILMLLVPGLLIAQTDQILTHEMGDEAARSKINVGLAQLDAGPINLGTFGDTQSVLSEASSNTNVLLGVYPMVNYLATAGKVFAGTHNRMLVITTNQTNNTSFYGAENQFRLKDVNIGQGVHAGVWAYAEQSGTSVLSGGGYFAGLHSAIESAAGFSAGATEYVLGVSINSSISINAGATINASANYSGLFIQSSGLDFFDGIYITGATNDIKLQNDATIENAVNGIMTLTEPVVAVDGDLKITGGLQYVPTVIEYTDTVTLTATEIVGSDAGDVGHADGAILVAAPGTGYAMEFVSAFMIYDYSTAAYTGGADDAVIQVGVTGTQVAVTGAITGASLLEAAADAILRLGSTATELVYADNGAISLHGTALTQPGTAAGELRVHITYRKHTTGL
jgi:hypothetical protein